MSRASFRAAVAERHRILHVYGEPLTCCHFPQVPTAGRREKQPVVERETSQQQSASAALMIVRMMPLCRLLQSNDCGQKIRDARWNTSRVAAAIYVQSVSRGSIKLAVPCRPSPTSGVMEKPRHHMLRILDAFT